MCGRFFLATSGAEIARHFELGEVPELAPRYNIAPGQPVPVVRAHRARAETAASVPAFRAALARRRGLVPADGFYEWQHRGRSTRPFAIRVRSGLFAMAAVCEEWEGPEGVLATVAVLTTEANEAVRPVHERMPVVVPPTAYAHWLDPEARDAEALAPLLRPCPAEWIAMHPVDRRVGDPREDDARLVEPERDLFSAGSGA
jgi:putative SOS response-associated peptidase YedK